MKLFRRVLSNELGFPTLEEYGIAVQEKWLFAGGNYEEGGDRLAGAFLTWHETV